MFAVLSVIIMIYDRLLNWRVLQILHINADIYNTELKTIPGRWWRSWMYPENNPMQTFTIEDEQLANPEVKF